MSSNELATLNAYFKNLTPLQRKEIITDHNFLTGQKQVSVPRVAKYWLNHSTQLNEVIPKILNLSNVVRNEQRLKQISNLTALQAQRREIRLSQEAFLKAQLKAVLDEATAKRRQEQEADAVRRRNESIRIKYEQALLNKQPTFSDIKKIHPKQYLDERPSLVPQGAKAIKTDNTINGLESKLASISKIAQAKGTDIKIVVEVKDTTTGKVLRSKGYTIPHNRTFRDFWDSGGHKWSYQKDTDAQMVGGGNADVSIYNASSGGSSSSQSYRDGDKTHCVLSHIQQFVDDLSTNDTKSGKKLYSSYVKKLEAHYIQYDNGVPHEELTALCDEYNIRINVKYPLDKTVTKYGTHKKPRRVITLVNTRMNHLEPNDEFNFNNPNRETVTREQLLDFQKELDDTNTTYFYTKDNINISSIITINKIYETNTAYKEAVKQLEEEFKLNNYKLDDFKDVALTAYIATGTHYNTSCLIAGRPEFKMNDEDETEHIDKHKAYISYQDNKYYEQFMGKITDIRKTDRIQGVGIYTIEKLDLTGCSSKFRELNSKMKAYKSGGTYPSPELNFLRGCGAVFNVVYGCWGQATFDLQFGDYMKQKTEEGSSYYALAVGSFDSHTTTSNYWKKADEEYFKNIDNHGENNVSYYGNGELKIEIDKTSNKHLGHITAFVLAYMRLSMIEQIMEMDLTKVNMVYVDGIYYQPHDFKMLNGFIPKPSDWKKHYRGSQVDLKSRIFREDEPIRDAYLSNNETVFRSWFKKQYCSSQPERDNHTTELFLGAGGVGKTHFNLVDGGLVRLVYVATSHKLVSDKMAEYDVAGEVFENLINEETRCFETDRINHLFNVLLIDEASQIRNCDMLRLLMLYPEHKIIVCGDIGFQVEPINTNHNPDGGDVENRLFDNVTTLTKNYRCKCAILSEKLLYMRRIIKSGKNINQVIKAVIMEHGKTVKLNELVGLYDVNDSIITGTNNAKVEITDVVKGTTPDKYYIRVRNDTYNVGDIVINPAVIDFKGDIEHAHTIHSVQGSTLKNKIFIDTRNKVTNMNMRLIYTAISRAEVFSNVYFIVDDVVKVSIQEDDDEIDDELNSIFG